MNSLFALLGIGLAVYLIGKNISKASAVLPVTMQPIPSQPIQTATSSIPVLSTSGGTVLAEWQQPAESPIPLPVALMETPPDTSMPRILANLTVPPGYMGPPVSGYRDLEVENGSLVYDPAEIQHYIDIGAWDSSIMRHYLAWRKYWEAQ